MTRASLILALPLVVAACSTDPCDGKGPMCISVHVDGPSRSLDAIDLRATVNGGAPLSASNSQAPITLPVQFAVILPADTSGQVALRVDGLAAGATVESGAGSVAVPPSRQNVRITLTATNDSDGGGGSDGGDGGGGDLGCMPGPPSLCAATDCGPIPDPNGCGMIDCGACQAFAIDEPLAMDGNTIAIEGKFSGTTTVSFPGSASPVMPATMGAARLTVVVPADATQGLLHVTSNGTTTAGLWFHHARYTPGVGTFRTEYEQTELARRAPNIDSRSGFTLTRMGNFVYAIGGLRSGPGPVTDLDTINRIMINADGTLSSAATISHLPTTRGGHSALVIGDRLFLLGGSSANVWSAQVGSDGTLGAFTDTGVTLARKLAAATIIGGFVYVFGGADANNVAQATILRAPIGSDGNLGAFVTLPATLLEPLTAPATCVRGSRVYILGGQDSNNMATSNIESAAINPDGSLGSFTTAATGLLQGRQAGECLALDTSAPALYVLGGSGASGPIGTVEKILMAVDGTVNGASVQSAALVVPRGGLHTVVIGSTLYAAGGLLANGSSTGLVEHASLDGSGNLGTFAPVTASQTTARFGHAAAVIGNWLYLVGGDPGPLSGSHALLASVERSPIAADGSLGAFVDLGATSKLKTARAGHLLVDTGSYLYAVGGAVDTAGTATNSIERAAIDPVTGSLGAFDVFVDGTATNVVLSSPRAGAAAWFDSGTLYVGGGHGASAAVQSIDSVSIDADGGISTQFAAASFDMAVTREQFRVAQLGANVHALGGLETTGPSANVYTSASFATFATDGALLGTARANFVVALVGDYLYVIGGRNTAPINSVMRSVISASDGLNTFGAITGLPAMVSHAAGASAGDFYYVLGGQDASNARQVVLGGARN